MTPQEFCYWLQGFLEVSGAKTISAEQVTVVRKHLDLVFTNVTGGGTPSKEQAKKLEELVGRLPRCSSLSDLRLC